MTVSYITSFYLFIDREAPLHRSLPMVEEQKVSDESPELWVGLTYIRMEKHIQPLLEGLERQELLIPHLQGQQL